MNFPQSTVQGVHGALSQGSLGRVLIHEHLVSTLRCYWNPSEDPVVAYEKVAPSNMSKLRANPFSSRDNLTLDDPRLVVSELASFVEHQGRTIVEVSSRGMGRDPRSLAWIAATAGVNIIAGCGYYLRKSHPADFTTRSVADFQDEMVQDLTVGMDGTEIRAGVIGELGVSSFPMDPVEMRVLVAAALAQQRVPVAVVVHSAPDSRSPFEIVDVLEEAGADLSRVVISHLDERFRDDLGLYQELARTGARLGLDTFGREAYLASRSRQHPTDESRIRTLAGLLAAGLGESVLVSQDICLMSELEAFGGVGYAHLFRNIVPRMIEHGIAQADVEKLLVDNPGRVLTGGEPC